MQREATTGGGGAEGRREDGAGAKRSRGEAKTRRKSKGSVLGSQSAPPENVPPPPIYDWD